MGRETKSRPANWLSGEDSATPSHCCRRADRRMRHRIPNRVCRRSRSSVLRVARLRRSSARDTGCSHRRSSLAIRRRPQPLRKSSPTPGQEPNGCFDTDRFRQRGSRLRHRTVQRRSCRTLQPRRLKRSSSRRRTPPRWRLHPLPRRRRRCRSYPSDMSPCGSRRCGCRLVADWLEASGRIHARRCPWPGTRLGRFPCSLRSRCRAWSKHFRMPGRRGTHVGSSGL